MPLGILLFGGGLHGFYIVVNHLWRSFKRVYLNHGLQKNSFITLPLSIFATFLAVSVSWVFFRAETYSGAINIFTGMLGLNGFILPEKLAGVFPPLISGVISFEGKGIGSFPDIWGAVWIVVLMSIVFIFPNSQEVVSKQKGTFKSNAGG